MQLDVKDAASIFNVSENTIYRWIRQRNLPVHRVNDQVRFNRAELLEWATAAKINVSAEFVKAPDPEEEVLPSLDKILKTGGIFYGVKGRDKASVLRSVVDLMGLPPDVDREFLYEVLLARESMGSTAIGDGIAIPHVRNPIVLHVPQPSITLCFLETPIDFDAPDGLPVSILFTLVSPTVPSHLHLLSRLAFVLKDPGFKALVTRQAPPEEILQAAHHVEERLAK